MWKIVDREFYHTCIPLQTKILHNSINVRKVINLLNDINSMHIAGKAKAV